LLELGFPRRCPVAAAFVLLLLGTSLVSSAQAERGAGELYQTACAACHGADGRGKSPAELGFETPVPDFTSCTFATREPDGDWGAVTHSGGPVRGFDAMMPAFGDALTWDEIELTLQHVRSFCPNPAWPRGELNLPRALFTEKAFPEDEAVFTMGVATEGDGAVANELVYEKRFGPRNQVEIAVPFGARERGSGDWVGGIGDIALGFKRALFHSLRRGNIFSAVAEVVLPTGDEDDGFGKGFTVFEPFLAFGQILPGDSFIQAQGGLELPLDDDGADDEAFLRLAAGRTWTQGTFGRSWTPMVELLAWRDLSGGADTHWDVVPQVQVTLNTRQHVMLNVGLRLPLDDTASRDTQLVVYLLWDWFDGGFFEGW
jgi:mono/diheme cytochrome c family protein